jgi:HAE1 family hydrophobic/amphiphilic exporter-1
MQKLAEICVRRPVFATTLILAMLVTGAYSFLSLGVDRNPNVDFPMVVVTVTNPGASPEEVETEVTDKVEAAVNTVSGIDELRSTSVEGVSQVMVSFDLDKDGDVAAQEVRDKVNLIANQLPATAEVPVIQKLDPDAQAVLQIAVSAPRPLREVTQIADEQIARRLENISGVGQVEIVGGSEREIQVLVNPERMRAYGVTVNEVANAVRQQNVNVPGGRIDEGAQELTVRTRGRIADVERFSDIAVAMRGSYVVKLGDVARVADASEELRTASLLDGEPAVTLQVRKQSGTNTVEVISAVKERLAEVLPTLPGDVKTQIVGDQSVFIEASLHAIQEHLVLGGILASIVVFIFLRNFRSTLIAAVAIPVSIVATFAAMAAAGYTLNSVTMLALTLMVGIVIDDAIVVLENIYRFIEEKGMSPYEAAVAGTKEIGLAVMATTLSLMAVFLPVGFMGGIVGRFMASFGLTSAFAIGISLVVSFTLTPMLAARFIKRYRPEPAAPGESDAEAAPAHGSKDSRFYAAIDRAYTWMLEWSMAHRWAIVAICLAVVLSTVPLGMAIGATFVPTDDQSQIEIDVETAEGSTLAATSTVAGRIAADVRRMPGVSSTLVTIGGGSRGSVNSATVLVQLVPIEERDLSQDELVVRMRDLLTKYPSELRTSVRGAGGIGGGNGDVQYVLSGPDLAKLTEYSESLQETMKQMPGVTDVDSSLVAGKPEVAVDVDRVRADDLGVSVNDVAQALNILVAGQDVSTFNVGTEQYDVVVRADARFRRGQEGLSQMVVPSQKAGLVTLDRVVRLAEGAGPSQIDRVNRQRVVTLSANLEPGASQSDVISRLNGAVSAMNLEPGYSAGTGGMSRELGKTAYYFLVAISLSIIFMYLVLAAQFESFIHPVTILLTLPIAVPFGILSLLLTGQTMNIYAGLGLLLLFGIVKKNAILQIDHTNTLRAHGLERYQAIIQANRDRLRPILMTTIALIAGMVPLVLSTGPGSGTNRSIGVLVAGGQALCLVLTLVAVPVFYSLFEDLQEHRMWGAVAGWFRGFTGRRHRGATEAAAR